MSTARDQIGKQAKSVMQDQQVREAAQDAAGQQRPQPPETELEYCEQARDKVLDVKRTAQQFIGDLPIKSVLIALGAGILLGTFWTIRRR